MALLVKQLMQFNSLWRDKISVDLDDPQTLLDSVSLQLWKHHASDNMYFVFNSFILEITYLLELD